MYLVIARVAITPEASRVTTKQRTLSPTVLTNSSQSEVGIHLQNLAELGSLDVKKLGRDGSKV